MIKVILKILKWNTSSRINASSRLGWRILPLCKEVRPPSLLTRIAVVCVWWLRIVNDRILVTEQSVTKQPNWSRDLQNSTLVFIGLIGWVGGFYGISTYRPSLPAGPQGYIPYLLRAAVCRFDLVTLLHLWARPYFSCMSGSSNLDSFRDGW